MIPKIITLIPLLLGLASCTPETLSNQDTNSDDAVDGQDGSLQCTEGNDYDGDTILTADELADDIDGDTLPNYMDPDSDGDTIPDRDEAGDSDCGTPPVDSDRDGTPDFLDLDSDGNTIPDYVEGDIDSDGDTVKDYRDPDNDGDSLPDAREIGDDPENPADSDDDGIPDYMDLDSDNDGIYDYIEKEVDVDRDGIPAYRDNDSDGDGYPDELEINQCDPGSVNPVDTDRDGVLDFLDTDSDGDGLSDGQERTIGSSPCLADTDGDGFDDLAEWAHPEADPTDPTKGIPEDDFYLILPPGGDIEERDLKFGTDITVADVFFVVDTTGSMYSEIDQIVETLSLTIIPAIRIRVPDAWFGVGWFADFPTGGYGSGSDRAFVMSQEMTPDVPTAQAAVEALPRNMGDDWPESQVEALYQTATGAGLGTWVPTYVCPDGHGAPCFRGGALPIVLLFTDAPFHNGPPGTTADSYTGIVPEPHDWTEAVTELNDIHAKVIGMNSEGSYGTEAQHDLRETAIATGTVKLDGNPLVFDIGSMGELLDTSVVDSIESLTKDVPFDVDTYTRDEPDEYTDPGWEEVDARCFIKKRIPQPGWEPPPGYTYEQAVAFYDQSAFYLVLPGTKVTFKVQFQNYIDEATNCYDGDEIARVFLAKIVVRGDGVTDLDEREVVIIVPAKQTIFG
jgi:hypothetical protein